MSGIRIDGMRRVQRRLEALAIPPEQRQRLLYREGKKLATANRKRLRAQKTPEGASLLPRKHKRRDRGLKTHTKMGRMLRVRSTPDQMTLDFQPRVQKIAAKHHRGFSAPGSAERNEQLKRRAGKSQQDPATRRQARALMREGFRIRGGGKRRQRASVKYIREHLTVGQAGVILRKMRREDAKPQQWEIPIPARPWFGASRAEQQQALDNLILTYRARVRRRTSR